jgi:hypothetical protein
MTTTDTTTETDDAPTVDDRDPATLIPAAVEEILRLAATWLAGDGAPRLGDGSAWTPLKALRRITDHLLDHLAEIEAVLDGQPTVPDSWLGARSRWRATGLTSLRATSMRQVTDFAATPSSTHSPGQGG